MLGSMSQLGGLPWGLEFVGAANLQLEFDHALGLLSVTVTNDGGVATVPSRISIEAELNLAANGGTLFAPGDGWASTASIHEFDDPASEKSEEDVRPERETVYSSAGMAVLSLPVQSPRSLLVGALALDRYKVGLETTLNSDASRVANLKVSWDLEATEISAGEALELPAIVVAEGADSWDLATDYARRVAEHYRVGELQPPSTAWIAERGSGLATDETDVLKNVDALRAAGFIGEFVQVSGGPQVAPGDWLAPDREFASQAQAAAGFVREAGYRPGIALAPLALHESSDTFAAHPEYALKDHDGLVLFKDTASGRCAVIDATHAGAREYLSNLVETVVHVWGYEYLNIDALEYGSESSAVVAYSQPGTSGAGHVREALKIIRQAAGAATTLVARGCPFGPAIGLVDAMKVGPGPRAEWAGDGEPSLKTAAETALLRGWMHGQWWNTHTGALIAAHGGGGLAGPEFRLLVTATALTGGSVVLAEDIARLDAARLDFALALIPPPGAAARPVDPFSGPVPSAWRADLGEGRGLLGVLNWTDSPRWVGISELLRPGEIAFDMWGRVTLGKGDVLLKPHEGALWQLSMPGPTPRLVGDSGHVAYEGLYQRSVSGRLQLRNDGHRERTVAVECRGAIIEVDLAPSEMRWFE